MNLAALFTLSLLLVLNAHAADEDEAEPPPPTAQSQSTWLFSWTGRPSATADPKAHVTGHLAYAQECVKKIAAAEKAGSFEEVAGCEGNGMAAGPGIYTCDNPFTSHDYGDTLVMMKAKAGDSRVANVSGLLRPADTISRGVTGNPNYDAVLYDFRPNEYGSLALAVRSPAALDLAQTQAFKVPPGARVPFRRHAPFACTETTSLPEVLNRWGDQLDFLALTFDLPRSSAAKGFERNGQLTAAGFAAAIASDAVALSDDELKGRIKLLKSLSPAIKESLDDDACADANHASPRMCLAYVLYDSITGEMGTPNHPTHAWPLKVLKPALVKLGLLEAGAAAKLKDQKALLSHLAKNFSKDPHQAQRAQEAFGCMKAVREALRPKSFASWEARAAGGDAAAAGEGSTSANDSAR
jgi:hypothetical protein